ncbi:hypothetical protein [Paenibacillus prosopidis]|uniref:Uncharacterized protein n=1 Tax=Paenibacillus prosopidis TaxID=630520 RepID=A0A368VUF6_9BACL|nr:hypothetical protein [Paenibacillus prosopidis]RCW45429.1 hypothetical protein DFP97_11017 [Paenibacillus prosopidis]
MDSNDENKERDAFSESRIPKGEEGVAATDGLSEIVEAYTDRIVKSVADETDAEQDQSIPK